MSSERESKNKGTVRRFQAATNTHDTELIAKTIDELFDPSAFVQTPVSLGVSGPSGIKNIFEILHRAYPDLHVTIEELIEEGDTVVSRNTVTGTHRGEYMGIAPTGRTVTYDEVFILRFVDGRIMETRGIVDVLSQLRQLGLNPIPVVAGRPPVNSLDT